MAKDAWTPPEPVSSYLVDGHRLWNDGCLSPRASGLPGPCEGLSLGGGLHRLKEEGSSSVLGRVIHSALHAAHDDSQACAQLGQARQRVSEVEYRFLTVEVRFDNLPE
jgi:hypothetical protein